ncbi:HAD family hydrolase [Staphylococcus felis]|nr:HAD hydrolase-like protein [Staphylococcus felis]REH92658.1 HAD family hydrolase [Staphylococcus felis]REI08733.1 HAD family hydrolase [Staphylococcus felis]
MSKAILFDVDGVFLDESRCFDVSALTIYELLYDAKFLNLASIIHLEEITDDEIQLIRSSVFQDDSILNQLKSLGLNSNWDMLFIVFSIHLVSILRSLNDKDKEYFLSESNFDETTLKCLGEKVKACKIDYTLPFEFINTVSKGKDAIYQDLKKYVAQNLNTTSVSLFEIQSPLWQLCQEIYQEWYLGTQLYEEVEKKIAKSDYKKGYIYQEKVLAPIDSIRQLLQKLIDRGYAIGIATGRPRTETIVPFETLGLLPYFDLNHVITASEVLKAEQMYPSLRPLGKPNPFTYIAAYLGNHETLYQDFATEQTNRFKREDITIVGDSLADLISAQKLGVQFIGTLTGLKGKKAAEELQNNGATNLVDTVLDIESYFV